MRGRERTWWPESTPPRWPESTPPLPARHPLSGTDPKKEPEGPVTKLVNGAWYCTCEDFQRDKRSTRSCRHIDTASTGTIRLLELLDRRMSASLSEEDALRLDVEIEAEKNKFLRTLSRLEAYGLDVR